MYIVQDKTTLVACVYYLVFALMNDAFRRKIRSGGCGCATQLAFAFALQDSENKGSYGESFDQEALPLKTAFELFDANFFSSKKMVEITKGAKELNVPTIRANRKLVGSVNGGLNHHSPLILELGELIKTKQVTSEELTQICLKRLKRYNPVLEAVISYTEDLAYKQAKEADDLFSRGVYLGPLHGIPYGLKDIISVPQYKTTWGSKSFKDQVLDIEAWVYKRLKSAGAVLVAKLVSGSLAYDDIWFGGRTRNPWNIEEFSTGSSAGPAACISAGLVPFAIGSETVGSMTLPASRCGVTALRPTFGLVGRTGVMSISESLDKLGPFCRSATDCAIVLDSIMGKDPDDVSSRDISLGDPFSVVQVLASKGVNMVPFKLNYTVDSVQGIISFTMDVDMLAHFDEWQRSGKDDDYEAQDQWPVELRRARFFPAVDYLQGKGKLMQEVRESFKVDAMIGSPTEWERVCMGNLVGMPVIVVQTGFTHISNPPSSDCRRRKTTTTGIFAPPYHDHIALALAVAYQSETNHHKQRPPVDELGPNDSIPNPPIHIQPPRLLRFL
uniref:Amidase domain-containing protein n=1 Tax=Cannabis sativa TaxID=3483 RepID=A0A803NVN3_CANSA